MTCSTRIDDVYWQLPDREKPDKAALIRMAFMFSIGSILYVRFACRSV
jgi:hypothetical protein